MQGFEYCKYGCPIPFAGTADPFIEFTAYGFRGYEPNGPLAGSYSEGERAKCNAAPASA